MNKETLKALKGSIGKWRRIVDRNGPDKASHNCPLCAVFCRAGNACTECPVRKRAGMGGCSGTPYADWSRSHNQRDGRLPSSVRRVNGDRALMRIAKAELKFLESLLPVT